MKPVIVLPKGLMPREDIKKLNANDFCVVECKDPARVKFIDPIPVQSSRTQIEHAAIKLCRVMINGNWRHMWNSDSVSQAGAAHILCQFLMDGTPLDTRGTLQEQEQRAYNEAKIDEMRRIAREDAKKERAAEKAKLLEDSKSKASQ